MLLKHLYLGATLAMILPLSATATPRFVLTDLGSLDAANWVSTANDINDNGQVTGESYGSSYKFRAYVWNQGSGMTSLGEPLPGFVMTTGTGISADGQISGTLESDDPTTLLPRAFVWNATDGITLIDTLGGTYSAAHAINDSHQVVGSSSLAGDTAEHAFRWDPVTGIVDLNTLGGDWSRAFGVNNQGQVVGASGVTSGVSGSDAFLWDPVNGMIDLGNLGGAFARAEDINESGVVTGYSDLADFGGTHAFIWNETDNMVDLGTLGGARSEAYGINNMGDVVGYSYTGAGADHAAFLWDAEDETMRDLNDLLVGDPGMYLRRAYAINNRDQIVGIGSVPSGGGQHAFLLTPVEVPEPPMLALLGIAIAGLEYQRRRMAQK